MTSKLHRRRAGQFLASREAARYLGIEWRELAALRFAAGRQGRPIGGCEVG